MKKLIDVSEFQKIIDWNKVKTQIDGAILRCGYGNDIKSQDDKMFERNASECERLEIPYGVYLYSYATDETMAKSEAAHILRLIKGKKLSLPIYLDCEEENPATRQYAKTACEIIGKIITDAGYQFGVYANLNWWNNYLVGVNETYSKWIAQYSNECQYKGAYDMWQYTSTGKVDGINGNVDINECYKDFTTDSIPNNQPVTPISVTYAVRANKTITDAVSNGIVCGKDNAKITDVAIKADGVKIKYRVHVLNGNWLPFVTGYNWQDFHNGYAGNGKVIDAIQIICDGDRKAKYRVSPIGSTKFYPYQYDNEVTNGQDGYAGLIGIAFDKLQIEIV